MKKELFIVMSLILLGTSVCDVVLADTAEASLDEVFAEVLKNNPELRIYQAGIDAAKGARKSAGWFANPEVSGSIGKKKVWDAEDSLTGNGDAWGVSVSQPLSWPGTAGLRRAIADRDIELAELGLEEFRMRLAAEVRLAVYEVVASRERAAAAREIAEHFRALREVLVQRGQAGLTPQLETRVIEGMELGMQRKASQAALAEQEALFRFNRVRGVSPGTAFPFKVIKTEFRPLEMDNDKLIALAKEQDPSVRRSRLEHKRQDLKVGLSESERVPDVSAGPSFSQETADGRERVVGAVVSMPLPLWNLNQGPIQSAKAERVQAETALEIARWDAERRIVEAALIYRTKYQEMSKWSPDFARHFREAAELSDRHYRLGAVPVSTFIELQTQYLETIEGLQETKREAIRAAADLAMITGAESHLIRLSAEGDLQ